MYSAKDCPYDKKRIGNMTFWCSTHFRNQVKETGTCWKLLSAVWGLIKHEFSPKAVSSRPKSKSRPIKCFGLFFFFYSSPIQCVTYSSSQSCCVKKAAFLKLDVASEASAVQQLNQYHLTSVRFTFPPCGQLYILYLSSVVLLYHSCAIYPVFCCRVINDLSCVLF